MLDENEIEKHDFSKLPVEIQTSNLVLLFYYILLAVTCYYVGTSVGNYLKITVGMSWVVSVLLLVDYLIRQCIRYRQEVSLNE